MSIVFIVDDSLDQCRALMRLVQMQGHLTRLFDGGQAVIDALNEPAARPDLVICDMAMPDVDGEAVLRWLRANDRGGRTPLVMYTAADDLTLFRLLCELGVNDIWLKGRMSFDVLEKRLASYFPSATPAVVPLPA
jgi:PleD family two-component response regulator